MSAINKDLEKEIINLKAEIDKTFIDLREEDMDEALRELRHRVFNAHTEIEISMEITIFANLLHSAEPKNGLSVIPQFMKNANPLISSQSFSKKLFLFRGILDPEGRDKTKFDKISELNEIRIDFAHPKNREYKKYSQRVKYKEALQTIKFALEVIKPKPQE